MTSHWKNRLLSLGSLLLFLFLFSTEASAGAGAWTARGLQGKASGSLVDISVDNNGATRLLMFDAAGRLVLGSVGPSGQPVFSQPYGPYPGWTPRASADGQDGSTRILWTHDDGSASLWLAEGLVARGAFRYERVGELTATDVAAGPESDTHILWTGVDGTGVLQTIDMSGGITSGLSFGPYPGWRAVAIADGPDGLTRLLWNHSDGRAGLSLVSTDGILTTARYEPATGSTAVDIAVGADGQTRILWSHDDGRMTLWRVDSAGSPTALGPTYAPPPGLTARGIATGNDGLTRVLWTSVDGAAIVWILSADHLFQQSFNIGPKLPPPAVNNIAGAWTGTFNVSPVGGDIDCDRSVGASFPAQATFQQNGSTVVGTLTAAGPCGFDYTFRGTLSGNALTGGVEGFPFPHIANGTLVGATLEITVFNSCACPGQVQLHR